MPLPVAALFLLLVSCGSATPTTGPSPAPTSPYAALEERFGIELRPLAPQEPNLPWWLPLAINYAPVTQPAELIAAFPPEQLEAELAKYPPDFFRRLGLRGVYWGRALESGLLTWRLAVGGVGFNIQGERWVILNLPNTPQPPALAAHTLHHEIFHALDPQSESTWQSCNPADSAYGFQPPEAVGREFDYPTPGFVSSYARTEAREDRAEVFALMMSNPTYAQLLEHWQVSDVYLRCKREQISQQLQQIDARFNQEHLAWVSLGLIEQLSKAQSHPEQITQLTVQGYNPTGRYQPTQPDSHHPDPFVLPDQIGLLSGLQHLELQQTDYTDLPASIGSLRQLRTLTLSGQRLKSFPRALLLLQQLRTLSLRNSGLRAIPIEVLALPHLQTLDIRDNELSEADRQALRQAAYIRGKVLQE